MSNYDRAMTWIDKMFRRYFPTGMTLENISKLIESKKPEQVRNSMTAAGRAFNKALRQYKETAFRAYPDRRAKA
jgi:hypothetical protein